MSATAAVRLCSDLPRARASRAHNGEWRLELAQPGVERLEYQLEVEHDDGGTECVLDPDNPHQRARRVRRQVGAAAARPTTPPAWLEDAPRSRASCISSRRRGPRRWRSTSTSGAPPTPTRSEPLPLLVAHDGPEYDRLAELTRFAAAKIAAGELPRHRVALLAPGRAQRVVLRLAALHARAHPRRAAGARRAGAVARPRRRRWARASARSRCCTRSAATRARFGALFLQSGSFFMPRYDAHESRFPHYHRIVGFVSETLRDGVPEPCAHHAHLRRRGGEHPQQPRDGARRSAGRRCTRCPTRTTTRPGATRSTRTSRACWPTRGERPRTPSCTRPRSARAAPSSPTATGAGRCSRSRPRAAARGTSSTRAWSARSPTCVDGGRVKLYCVDSFDAESWSNRDAPARGARAQPRALRVVDRRPGRAAHPRRLRRARRRSPRSASASAPTTRSTSRSSAPTCSRSRSASPATTTRRPGTAGASAARPRTSTTRSTTSRTWAATTSTGCAAASACCSCAGRASGRTRTGSLESTKRLAHVLREKGIRHELDLWGHDVPHDWPSWRAQLAHHLPRFC